jgi:DNA replication protein DnaC
MTSLALKQQLKELRLPSMRDAFVTEAESCRTDCVPYEDYLGRLCEIELEERRQRKVERLLFASRLPREKRLDGFERSQLPMAVTARLNSLLEGSFLDRRENVLVFGTPGSGKTHLLCAIGHELVQQGHSVLFQRCDLLVQDLLAAKRDLRLAKHLKKLGRFEALIIDDIGYVQQSREEMEVLFTLLAERYERGSVLLTSNLPFSRWDEIFKDPMTTAAAIDRLVHHSTILEMNLPSYRLKTAENRTAKEGCQETEKDQ